MFSHFKYRLKKILMLILLIVVSAPMLYAQYGNELVNMTVQVMPPYTNKLSDYFASPGKIVSFITTNEIDALEYKYYIHGYLQSVGDDYATSIGTRNGFVPANPSTMKALLAPDGGFMAWQPYTLTYSDYQQIFNPMNLEYSGLTREMIERDGIPAGMYQICFRVFMEPYGNGYIAQGDFCSPPFMITPEMSAVEPPIVIQPYNETNIPEELSKSLQFTWTMPPGAPAGTQYKIKIIEINDQGMNYRDMLRTDAYPAFFETTVSGVPTYLYTIANPAFKVGKDYAFVVQAIDPMGQTNFKNGGYSEVNIFSVGEKTVMPDKPLLEYIPRPKTAKAYDVTNDDPVPMSQIKGKLYYKFKEERENTNKNKPTLKTTKRGEGQSSDGLTYNVDNTSAVNAKPLAGKRISLVMTYLFTGTDNTGNQADGIHLQKNGTMMRFLPDEIKRKADIVMATAVTGSDGSFIFNFLNTEKEFGLIDDNVNVFEGPTEFTTSFKGRIFKVLRIKVDDKYYLSPDVNIKLNPWEGIDLGTLISYVKSYDLKVKMTTTSGKFWDMAYGQGSDLPGIASSLIRKQNIQSVPTNEGGGMKTSVSLPSGNGRLVANGTTDKSGYILFKDLVQHDPDNNSDRYYLKCVPDLKTGDFIFKEKEKRYNKSSPVYYNDFPFNTYKQSWSSTSDGLLASIETGEDITWNSELVVKTYETTIELQPKLPRIAGQLFIADNVEHKPFKGVNVVMYNFYEDEKTPASKLITSVKTNSLGEYEFNNLPVEHTKGIIKLDEINSIIGPKRILTTHPAGFKSARLPAKPATSSTQPAWQLLQPAFLQLAGGEKRKIEIIDGKYAPFKYGQQLLNLDFYLTPDGLLKGFVEDEEGNPVRTTIDIDGYVRVETKGTLSLLGIIGEGRYLSYSEYFSIAAPSGKRKITITPADRDYAVKDTTLTIKKDTEIVKFVVKLMQKRIRFQVVGDPGNTNSRNLKPIPGVTVKLKDIPGVKAQTTDENGFVQFNFKSSGENFDFVLTPSDDAGFADKEITISDVKDDTEVKNYGAIKLQTAVNIAGIVTLGVDKKALEGADVYIDFGKEQIKTTTDQSGKYILKKVPALPVQKTVSAGKGGTTPMIISQNKEISVSVGKNNQLDFNLIDDNEITIPEIFGFKFEVAEKSDKQPDDTWLVSGNLIINSNDNFALQNEKQNSIPIANLKVHKSGEEINGIPVGVPVSDRITTDLASLNLLYQNAFGVVQYPESGGLIEITGNNDRGSVTGKVYLKKAPLQFSKNTLKFNDDPEKALLFTEKPGSVGTVLSTIESSSGAEKKRYGIADLDGKLLKFSLGGFNASASSGNSWIEGNTINLRTVIHLSDIPKMPSGGVNIDAGDLVVSPDQVGSLRVDKPIKFELENWQFEGNEWQLYPRNGKITISSGVMHTGSLDIPLKDISIEPNKLNISSFDVKNISMADIIPVDVISQNPVFGYNRSAGNDHKPHYEFRLIGEGSMPGVEIRNLPGMKPGAAFKFQNFSLFSNGDQILNPGNQVNNTVLYSVMSITPTSFTSGADFVNMSSDISLGIPQLPKTSGVIQFTKASGKIKLRLYPLNVSLKGPGGVDFLANVQFNDNPQSLKEGEFTALGTIKDKEGINLKAVLNRTPQAAWVQISPENQTLPLGGNNTRLANIKGRMEADISADKWRNLVFSGEMQGFKGMEGDTRKTFTVTGSINATNEKIDVKNIPSAFGNINITYDIANSRFIGNLQFDKTMGPLSIAGAADLLVDPGGWYILAGGKLTTPGLGEANAGMLIGDYNSMPAHVSQTLMQFAYNKNVPKGYQNGVSGFFFTGNKDLPVINIPDWSIDLEVISAKFGVRAGVDARLWMDFNKGGNEYGIGAMAFALAYLKGEAITCTKFAVEQRLEMGAQGVYTTSNGAFSLSGCGSFTMSGSVEQCFPIPCLDDGICCSGCLGVSKSVSMRMDLLLDSKGNTDLSFGMGNCSGQAPLTGNW